MCMEVQNSDEVSADDDDDEDDDDDDDDDSASIFASWREKISKY